MGSGGTLLRARSRVTITWRRAAFVQVLEAAVVGALLRRWCRAQLRRERAIRTAHELGDLERLRIASDLHDGAVQDIAGSAYAVAALARRDDVPVDARDLLAESAYRLRQGVRSLRSVLVEIHPPNVRHEGLATAIGDLLTRVHGRGVETALESSVSPGAAPPGGHAELLYRVGLETIRHVLSDARVRSVAVELEADAERWQLRIDDSAMGSATGPGTRVGVRRSRLAPVTAAVEAAGGGVTVLGGRDDDVCVCAWLPR